MNVLRQLCKEAWLTYQNAQSEVGRLERELREAKQTMRTVIFAHSALNNKMVEEGEG